MDANAINLGPKAPLPKGKELRKLARRLYAQAQPGSLVIMSDGRKYLVDRRGTYRRIKE